MISAYKDDAQLAIEMSVKISEATGEKQKAFNDGEFVKHCLMIIAEKRCP